MAAGFERSGTVLTVHLPTELDHPVSDEIRRESDRIIGHEYIKNMIFDFSETVFMDSSGIGLLMGRYRALGMRGKCVQVMNVNSHIAKLLRLSGVGRYIDICKTQEAAEEGAMMLYVCESCGGEILADKTTGATSCPYCGNKVVMKGQFDGALRPDYIIPFKKDKKQAKEAYRKHLEGKKFLPGVFKQQNHIDEIKGVYVPFWIFDLKAKADFSYHAEKTRVWVSNDIEYTEHENFEVKRAGTVEFEKVPADGSKKMDDTLMESVEPYDFKEAVPFRMAYMAGYLADRYDVPKEECIGRAKKRIRRSTEREIRNTVKGYHVIDQEKANMEIKDQAKYALYPVWILNTTWKDKKYIFAMNGQTGKIVGDLPADNGAFWRFVAMWGAGIGLVLYALLWVFMVLL